MSKSHVSVSQRICQVCAQPYDTGVLLHKRLSPVLEPTTITGWGLCPEHQALYDQGYIAAVGCDPTRSHVTNKQDGVGSATQESVWRTGSIAHIKADAWERIFRGPPPRNLATGELLPLVFCEEQVIEMLQAAQGR